MFAPLWPIDPPPNKASSLKLEKRQLGQCRRVFLQPKIHQIGALRRRQLRELYLQHLANLLDVCPNPLFKPLQRPINLFHFPQIDGLFFLLSNLLRNLRRRQLLLRQLNLVTDQIRKSLTRTTRSHPFIPKLARARHPPSTCFLNIPLDRRRSHPKPPCRLALRYPRHLMWMLVKTPVFFSILMP